MQQPIIINHKEENSVLKIFPFKPILSSTNKGKSGIHFEHYQLTAHETPEYVPMHHAIAVSYKSIKIDRYLDGKLNNERFDKDHILVTPSKVAHKFSCTNRSSFSLLYFQPQLIKDMAFDLINPDRIELLPHLARPDPLISGIARFIGLQAESERMIDTTYFDQLSLTINMHLLKYYCSKEHQFVENNYKLSKIQLEGVKEYIENNLSQKLELQKLADVLGLSRYHFARIFKKTVGITPAHYIIDRRLAKATDLLNNTSLNAGAIARQVGFCDHSHFSRSFKKNYGLSPDQYRNLR
jgi:AraC family transcriptional regulator